MHLSDLFFSNVTNINFPSILFVYVLPQKHKTHMDKSFVLFGAMPSMPRKGYGTQLAFNKHFLNEQISNYTLKLQITIFLSLQNKKI